MYIAFRNLCNWYLYLMLPYYFHICILLDLNQRRGNNFKMYPFKCCADLRNQIMFFFKWQSSFILCNNFDSSYYSLSQSERICDWPKLPVRDKLFQSLIIEPKSYYIFQSSNCLWCINAMRSNAINNCRFQISFRFCKLIQRQQMMNWRKGFGR